MAMTPYTGMTNYWLSVVRGLLLVVGILCISYSMSTEGSQPLQSILGGAAAMLSVTLQRLERGH